MIESVKESVKESIKETITGKSKKEREDTEQKKKEKKAAKGTPANKVDDIMKKYTSGGDADKCETNNDDKWTWWRRRALGVARRLSARPANQAQWHARWDARFGCWLDGQPFEAYIYMYIYIYISLTLSPMLLCVRPPQPSPPNHPRHMPHAILTTHGSSDESVSISQPGARGVCTPH